LVADNGVDEYQRNLANQLRHEFPDDDLHALSGGQVGAIGRSARSFISHYGMLEHQVVRGVDDDFTGKVRRGACRRKREYKTDERPRPAISPDQAFPDRPRRLHVFI
jgi:hypothetical protein